MKKIELKKYFYLLITVLIFLPSVNFAQNKDSVKTKSRSQRVIDSLKNLLPQTGITGTNQDTTAKNPLQIDTAVTPPVVQDTAKRDTSVVPVTPPSIGLTNTEVFFYSLITIVGVVLLYFVFVNLLFRTFLKTRSSRQSMLLSWSLFLLTAIVWVFIIWGLVAGLWTSTAFTVAIIFLFIVFTVMTITAVKSR